ncbi:BCK1 protein [Uncinocarpus reesii 1704]|uniref:Mitogen-activated protein kinase kinae kinase bck1 n=1 Tax=Uncinocarpus reesii (strain UAMH 1704) TaxID=336963 RepID=C4JZ95_UNCRE|nr:BCK1 protein [Uncinocarpus reesii 1704]EEP82631.1 BCK1 protein [Uncinocarpus reesii 1704]
MDGQRQQPYVPGPPPQSIPQATAQSHMMQIPPPPPRVTHTTAHTGGLPPPPPGPPPGSAYGNQPGWQWARQQQGFGQGYYPPPPPLTSSNQLYNQHLAYSIHQPQNPGSLSIQQPPSNDPPLTSATYIPGGSSFGPGVGIPPLIPHDNYDHFSRPERAGYPYDPDALRYIPESYADKITRPQIPLSYREQSDTAGTLNPSQNPHVQSSHQNSQVSTRENSSRQTASAASNGLSAHEADEKWPLDRVLQWLAHNGFSTEWQETFRALDLKGAKFIELGCGGANGMGNFGKMHQDIYPQLAKEYGAAWDPGRERDEGVRMRKLIRSSAETKHSENTSSGRFYEQHASASTDGGVETSPHLRPDSFPFDPSSTEFGHQETTSRSELSRNILGNALGEWRRHSPSASSDHGNTTSKSRGGSPATQFASMVTAEPTGTPGEMTHAKRNSSDSIMSRSFRQGQGPPMREHPMKQSEMPSKDHKGFLNAIRKKLGPSHPSPDDTSLDTPSSPARYAQSFPYSGRTGPNSSEPSLGYGISQPSTECHARKVIQNPPPKRFIFVTLDGWNYRLVDVTDVDAADMLRAHLCNGVGIKDPSSALIYVTEPGKVDHEEPLSDTMLVVNRRSKSDDQGSLKLYVQSMAPPAFGLGLSFSERVANGAKPQRSTTEDDARNRTNHVAHPRRVSPAMAHRASMQNLASYSPFIEDDRWVEESPEEKERNAAILAAHKEHRRVVEEKQRLYLQSKREQLQKEANIGRRKKPKDSSAQSSDQARSSKDFLVDTRERSSSFSPKSASPSMGIAAAIANMGKISGSIAKPLATSSPFSHSPRTPSESEIGKLSSTESADTGSAGSHRASPSSAITRGPASMFNVPIHNDGISARKASISETPSSLPEKATYATSLREPSRVPSQSRLSHGPDFDFQETEVLFVKSPQPPPQDSDEASDEDLFIKPLANRKPKPKADGKAATGLARGRLAKPALTVNTNSRAVKGLSVTFKSPGPADAFTPLTDHSDPRSGHHSGDPDTDDLSPQDLRNSRRRSFVRDDVWASRPPVEGMIDHLEDFFPNIDLDEPYLEGITLTPPMSPTATPSHSEPEPELTQNLREHVAHAAPNLSSILRNPSDTLGSDESTLKAKVTAKNVAQRNVSRAGGLSRMKSIREVAKGAHQIRRNQSSAASKNAQSGMLRRKSTKMFGARIMQISPKPGSRLSDLDPLPQHPVPFEKVPQRQPTFRIIRGELIGKGTYGRVYLGMNAETGEFLAVKLVEVNQKAAGYDKDRIKEMVSAMDQEIDTMQHLEHPNIVQYLGCHRTELSISIYLEYIPGGSIGSCLRKHGKFEESVVKSLTIQTLRGLSYLHNQGILHRDLKADNILLDLDGTCKISDFGISKKTDNIYGNDVTNSMQGSVFWMAPEVVQSQGKGYSAKVDIWSLGCVVLEMFAGRRPWSKEEAIGAIFKLGSLNQAPPIPEDVSLNISPAALSFMLDCFTINTYERPTAGTLLSQHHFCIPDPNYHFFDTELHAKIGHL